MSELAAFLESFLGSPVRTDGAWLHTLMAVDGGYFNARLRNDPVAELFVTPRALDGFELTLRGERMRPDATFETALTVQTNDHELARMWLDQVAREQILDSAYEYHLGESYIEGLGAEPPRPGVPFRRIWTYELANEEMVATKGNVETQLDRLALALETAAVIVARTRRWAAEYAAIGHRIGASSHAEVEVGGAPVLTSNRAAVEVSLQLLRRLPGERTGRLRTLIAAKRVGHHDDRTYSLVDRSARSTMVPPLPEGDKRDFGLDGYRARASTDALDLDELAKKQLLAARPSVVAADLDSIDIWFDGAPMELERIDAAFALAAHLALGSTAQHGPYR
jgi:hypothetical protein